MARTRPQEICWDCSHEYALHGGDDTGTGCTRCSCTGFVPAGHPWRLRLLLWLDRRL